MVEWYTQWPQKSPPVTVCRFDSYWTHQFNNMWLGGGMVYTLVLETSAFAGLRVRLPPEPPHICAYGGTVYAAGLNPVVSNGMKVRILLGAPNTERQANG